MCVSRPACVQGRKREAVLQVGLFLGAASEAELCGGRAGLQAGRGSAAEHQVCSRAEAHRAAHHRAPPHGRGLLDRAPEEPQRRGQQLGLLLSVLLAGRQQV